MRARHTLKVLCAQLQGAGLPGGGCSGQRGQGGRVSGEAAGAARAVAAGAAGAPLPPRAAGSRPAPFRRKNTGTGAPPEQILRGPFREHCNLETRCTAQVAPPSALLSMLHLRRRARVQSRHGVHKGAFASMSR